MICVFLSNNNSGYEQDDRKKGRKSYVSHTIILDGVKLNNNRNRSLWHNFSSLTLSLHGLFGLSLSLFIHSFARCSVFALEIARQTDDLMVLCGTRHKKKLPVGENGRESRKK